MSSAYTPASRTCQARHRRRNPSRPGSCRSRRSHAAVRGRTALHSEVRAGLRRALQSDAEVLAVAVLVRTALRARQDAAAAIADAAALRAELRARLRRAACGAANVCRAAATTRLARTAITAVNATGASVGVVTAVLARGAGRELRAGRCTALVRHADATTRRASRARRAGDEVAATVAGLSALDALLLAGQHVGVPHLYTTPPPPQTWPAGHCGQVSRLPQPSEMEP